MLQAIGEGVELLHKGGNGFNLELAKIFRNWSNGSVIRGWLVELMEKGLLELFKSRIKDSDTYKSIALVRHGFGGHPFGKDEYIAKESETSRINRI